MADDPSQLLGFNDRYEDPAEDPLFNIDGGSPDRVDIFTREGPPRVGHVSGSARIVDHGEEIEDVAAELRLIVQNDPPNDAMIYDKTGTGKPLVARRVTERARRATESNGVSVGTVYVDCTQHNAQTRTAWTVTRKLNKIEKTGFGIPRTGIGSGEYYDYLWEIPDLAYDAVVIILDEVSRLNDDGVLMQLSWVRESGKADCHLDVIAASNKVEYRGQLNKRVKSGPREEKFVLQPYDVNQLRGIMKYRRNAFHDDVLSGDVILLAAALTTQEHDDARKAIEILRYVGELTEREDAD